MASPDALPKNGLLKAFLIFGIRCTHQNKTSIRVLHFYVVLAFSV